MGEDMRKSIGPAIGLVAGAFFAGTATSGEALRYIQTTCAPAVKRNAIIKSSLLDLAAGRFSEAQRTIDYLLGGKVSPVEAECLNAARVAIPEIEADLEREADERKAAAAKRAAEKAQAQQPAQGQQDLSAESNQTPNKDPVQGCRLLVLQFGEMMAFDASPKCREVLAQEQARTPPAKQLEEVYGTYLLAKDCYEIRKEFQVPYVTKQQFDMVRGVTRSREKALLAKYPELSRTKDGVWDTTVQNYSSGGATFPSNQYSKDAHSLCRRIVSGYADDAQSTNKPKKDF
jgi:hypothetical protein